MARQGHLHVQLLLVMKARFAGLRRKQAILAAGVVVAVGLIAAGLTVALSTDGSTPQGDALHDENSFYWSRVKMAPGQRFVLMVNDIVNRSDAPIVIKDFDAISQPDPSVAELERIALAPRREGAGEISPGSYLSYPPAAREEGSKACVYQEIVRPGEELVLHPYNQTRKSALVVMVIRTSDPGYTEFDIARVLYEQEGTLYQQDVPLEVRLQVVQNGRPMRPGYEERPCLDRSNALSQPDE